MDKHHSSSIWEHYHGAGSQSSELGETVSASAAKPRQNLLGHSPYHRRLLCEPLEDRRLLSAFAWSTYLGGSRWDSVSGMVMDKEGNAFVVANTQSTDFAGATNRMAVAVTTLS